MNYRARSISLACSVGLKNESNDKRMSSESSVMLASTLPSRDKTRHSQRLTGVGRGLIQKLPSKRGER